MEEINQYYFNYEQMEILNEFTNEEAASKCRPKFK